MIFLMWFWVVCEDWGVNVVWDSDIWMSIKVICLVWKIMSWECR